MSCEDCGKKTLNTYFYNVRVNKKCPKKNCNIKKIEYKNEKNSNYS